MTIKNLVLIAILIIFSFSSCKFEKRLYSKGFNVTTKNVMFNKPKSTVIKDWKSNKTEDPLENPKPIIDNKKAILKSEKLIIETTVNLNSKSEQTNKIIDYKSPKKEPKHSSYRTIASHKKKFISEPDEESTPKFLPNADFVYSSSIAALLTVLSLGILGPFALVLGALAIQRQNRFPSLGAKKSRFFVKFSVIIGFITTLIPIIWFAIILVVFGELFYVMMILLYLIPIITGIIILNSF